MADFAGFRRITVLCQRKSKIAQGLADEALAILGRVAVGDQRLHAVLDSNAASASEETRAFVVGRARQQKPLKPITAPADLDALERACLEDNDVDADVAARRFAKIALARQFRESSNQQTVIVKRQKLLDWEKYEAEASAVKERHLAERDAAAKAEREERERERVHASELAAERRRAEIREAAAKGLIAQAAAEDMLAENRQTLILRLEEWIRTRCKCPEPSSCASLLSRKFNEEVEAGRHVKPSAHRNEAGRWKYFVEHDGPVLAGLHRDIHDRRNGVTPGQTRPF
ncbi:MAG: hypothetical protein EB084_25875 [Proteobacteria bacterium]|nr:hypothetical protein [Pseudomonadota bacterium]